MKIIWKCLIAIFFFTLTFSGLVATNHVLAHSLLESFALRPSEVIAGVRVEMSISPAVSEPGESVTLELVMINTTDQDVSPQVDGVLPEWILFDPNDLPTGAVYDAENRHWFWQPDVPAGQQRHFALPFVVESTTIEAPIHQLQSVFRHAEQSLPLTAEYWVGSLPSAKLTTPSRISVGQPISLSAEISGPLPIVQTWKLGDGREIESNTDLVVYETVGSYDLSLEVTNPLGSYQTTQKIEVVAEPSADFILEDSTPGIEQPVRFVNHSGGQPPLRYRWDFGDGTTSADENPIHIYRQQGHYVIQLFVENDLGVATQEQKMIVGVPPSAEIALPLSTTVGLPINAVGSAESDGIEYRWNMGDGNFVTGENITHLYNNAGLYAVTMTAINDYGETQRTKIVEVKKANYVVYLPVVMRDNDVSSQVQTLADYAYAVEIDQVDLTGNEPPANTTQTEQLLWYINQARISFNLKPVALVPVMSVAAQRHTNDMAFNRFTAHTGSDGTTPVDRLNQSGYTGSYRGEATAWGFDHPTGAVGFWLQSPPHRAILLNPYPTDVGVGYTYDPTAPSIYYWTFEFGSGVTNGLDWPVANMPSIELTPVVTPTIIAVTEPAPETVDEIIPTATVENLSTETAEPTIEVDATPTAELIATPIPIESPTIEDIATAEATIEPTSESTIEPTAEPTTEPTAEPTAESTIEPTAELIATLIPIESPTREGFAPIELTAELTLEPTTELTLEPTTEPTLELTAEPTLELTAEPTLEPTAEPTLEPTAEPTLEPTAEPTLEPTAEPTAEPTLQLVLPTVEPTLPPIVIVTEELPTPEPVLPTAEPTIPLVTIVPEVIPTEISTPEPILEGDPTSLLQQEKMRDSNANELLYQHFLDLNRLSGNWRKPIVVATD